MFAKLVTLTRRCVNICIKTTFWTSRSTLYFTFITTLTNTWQSVAFICIISLCLYAARQNRWHKNVVETNKYVKSRALSLVLIDRFGPEVLSTLWMKGQVLHRARERLKLPGLIYFWPLLLSCLKDCANFYSLVVIWERDLYSAIQSRLKLGWVVSWMACLKKVIALVKWTRL